MHFSFLSQLAAIAHYEMLIQWRRGNLKMIAILLVFAPLCLIVLGVAPDSMTQRALAAASDASRPVITMDVAVFATVALLPLLLFGLPLYVSESIPYDRQYGVRDLLDTLPIGRGTYLCGKILAVWITVLGAVAIGGLLSGLVSTLTFGVLDPLIWFILWVGGFLLLGLFASGISILVAAGQPNRRRALFVGFAGLPLYFAAYGLSPLANFTISSLNRMTIVTMNQDVLRIVPASAMPSSWSFVAWSLLVVVAVWVATWGWMRWHENHA